MASYTLEKVKQGDVLDDYWKGKTKITHHGFKVSIYQR